MTTDNLFRMMAGPVAPVRPGNTGAPGLDHRRAA